MEDGSVLLPDRAPPHARPELSDPRGRERNLQLAGNCGFLFSLLFFYRICREMRSHCARARLKVVAVKLTGCGSRRSRSRGDPNRVATRGPRSCSSSLFLFLLFTMDAAG